MRLLFISLSLLLFSIFAQAQLADSTNSQLDALFENWKDPNKPGVAGGVIQNGKILYLKGFGSADLAQNIPITPDTKFHIGNLSKQFTVFATLLLAEKGKLSLTDDIRKYLPQLPNYGDIVTVDDLIKQSSGLNEFWALKEIAGWSPTALFTQEDAMKLIQTQTTLNYQPGTNFSRTSTGMVLLTEIIEKVTGETFAEFCQNYIFSPLGMKNTAFIPNQEEIIDNLAKSYQATKKGYQKRQITQILPTLSLYTSASDLSKWYQNHVQPKIGSPSLFKKLESPAELKDGRVYRPTVGELTYNQTFWHLERGEPMYWAYALEGGYAANIFRFPEYDLTSFVLGNNNQYNGMPAMSMAFVFLEDKIDLPRSIDFSSLKTISLSTEKLNSFTGDYWDDKGAYHRKIYNKNDTLRYSRVESGVESALLPVGENLFQMIVGSDDIIKIKFEEKNGNKTMITTVGTSDEFVYEKFTPNTYTIGELTEFTGIFFCEALSTAYKLSTKENKLVASHPFKEDIYFEPVQNDLFRGSEWYFGSIQFNRDEHNTITGFTISFDGISNLPFTKINTGISQLVK